MHACVDCELQQAECIMYRNARTHTQTDRPTDKQQEYIRTYRINVDGRKHKIAHWNNINYRTEFALDADVQCNRLSTAFFVFFSVFEQQVENHIKSIFSQKVLCKQNYEEKSRNFYTVALISCSWFWVFIVLRTRLFCVHLSIFEMLTAHDSHYLNSYFVMFPLVLSVRSMHDTYVDRVLCVSVDLSFSTSLALSLSGQ